MSGSSVLVPRWFPRAALALGLVWLPVLETPARADETTRRARIDRLALDNGVRVVLVRTERAGPVAVTVAVRDPSPTGGGDALFALTSSEAAPRGELPVEERATLLTARGVRARTELTGGATLRSLVGPGDELPLLLYLTGQTLRDARWDEASLARASAHPSRAAGDAPRAFAVARERLFPRAPLLAPEPAARPLDRLRAVDRARTRLETVVTVVGDFDADRAAELVHQHLDAAPPRASAPFAAPAPAPAPGAPLTLVSPTFAVSLAVRIDGPPGRRRALRAAFDVFSRVRLRGLRDLASTLMVNEMDELTAGARLVGLRFVVADATALRAATAALATALAKLVSDGVTPAELAVANARLAVAEELRVLSPVAHAGDTALSELAGERSADSAAAADAKAGGEVDKTAAASPTVLAEAFGDARRVTVVEQPAP